MSDQAIQVQYLRVILSEKHLNPILLVVAAGLGRAVGRLAVEVAKGIWRPRLRARGSTGQSSLRSV